MRKRLKIKKNSTGRFRRLPLVALIVTATSVAAIAAVTVISRQKAEVKSGSDAQESRPAAIKAAPAAANKTYVTVKVAGQDVQIDGQTGQMRPLSQEETQKLAAGLKQEINQTTDGLVEKHSPNGTVSVELNGHFQNVAVARRNDDGTVSSSCVDNPQAAGAFFGIDPQLIDRQAAKNVTGQQRQPARPVNNENQ